MEKLTEKQKIEYEEKVKKLLSRGIEIGKVIELWQSPERFRLNGNDFLPDNLAGSDKREHVCFYKDQYGIIQSAILVQKYFAVITRMEPYDYYGMYVSIFAETDDFVFNKTTDNEWQRMRKDGKGYSLEFISAEQAYNGTVLFLDKEGNRPKPTKPILICEKHDWAHRENEECFICAGHDNRSEIILHKQNTGQVVWKNNDVFIVPQKH